MPSAGGTTIRHPLSELPLSLYLPALNTDGERSPSSSSKGKEKERADVASAGRERETSRDAIRPGSLLKPRALLVSSAKMDLAGPSSAAALMSPAKRRLLEGSPRSPRKSASMSSLRAPQGIASSSSAPGLAHTPARRMMHLDDELARGLPKDEDDPQRAWEARSPARRLFMDGEAAAGNRALAGSPLSTLAPRPMWSEGTPAFLDAAAPVNGAGAVDSGATPGLAPSPPIKDTACGAAGDSMLGSPTTPRPSKRSKMSKGSPAVTVAVGKTSTGHADALPSKTASPARSTRSRPPINLLDDLENDVFSSPVRTTKGPSGTGDTVTPSSSGSRSNTHDSSNTHTPSRSRGHSFSSDAEISYDAAAASANIDVSHCGFEIWDDERERERERGDSARVGAALPGLGRAIAVADGAEELVAEVDQENQPPVADVADRIRAGPEMDAIAAAVHVDEATGDVVME